MTKQQIKDYEKVQSIDIVKEWISGGGFADSVLETLPIECAISDMEMVISDGEAELECWINFPEEYNIIKKRIKAAKWFIRKYSK